MSLEQQFFELYGGLHRARGKNETLNQLDQKGKRKSKNQTLHQPYTQDNWIQHLNGVEGLGVIPITDEATCNWGAIDIDIYPLDLVELEQKLKAKNLPMVVLRTKSGGAHLTCYFKEYQSCASVRGKLAEISLALGLGEREIYPKQIKLANNTDVGNWLNMPYFNYQDTERYAIINGKSASVEEFLDYANSIRIDNIDKLIVELDEDQLSDGPPCLQYFMMHKAGPGERNNVLFNFGVYSRAKWESEWEPHLEQFNREILDPPLSHREVAAIVKSLEKKSYSFTCNNPPICNHCNREACKNREYGIGAFQHIDVGIAVDSISKMNSEPPMWVLSLEGIRTEIETEELLDQNKFRKVCVNVLNKIPGRMKAEDWDKFVRNKLSEIEIIEMPIETKTSELAVTMLPKFFGSTPKARVPTEMRLGRWYIDRNNYIFRGVDFIKYLERNNVSIDNRKLWSVLKAGGVENKQINGQEVWCVSTAIYQADKDKLPKVELPDENY